MEDGALQEGRRVPPPPPTFMTTSAVLTLQRPGILGSGSVSQSQAAPDMWNHRLSRSLWFKALSPLSLSFFFFPPWLECHRLPIFKLSLEEVGRDRVPKVFFFSPQFPFGDQRPTRSGLSCREQNVRSITTAVWS